MHSFKQFSLAIVAVLTAAIAPGCAQTTSLPVVYACFGGGDLQSNPQVLCANGAPNSELTAISMDAAAAVSGQNVGIPQFSTLTLGKRYDSTSEALLNSIARGTTFPTIVIGIYSSGAKALNGRPDFTVMLQQALVTNAQWSASMGTTATGPLLTEDLTLSFARITIVDNSTGNKVIWSPK